MHIIILYTYRLIGGGLFTVALVIKKKKPRLKTLKKYFFPIIYKSLKYIFGNNLYTLFIVIIF